MKAIHLGECNGYTLRYPQSGGKAGSGLDKAGSIQVLNGNQIVKNIRFRVGDVDSKRAAWNKAQEFARSQPRGKSLTELAALKKKANLAEQMADAFAEVLEFSTNTPPQVRERGVSALAAWREANR